MDDTERDTADLLAELQRLDVRRDEIDSELRRRTRPDQSREAVRYFRTTAVQRDELIPLLRTALAPWGRMDGHYLQVFGDFKRAAADIEAWADSIRALDPQRAHSLNVLASKVRAVAPLVLHEEPEVD